NTLIGENCCLNTVVADVNSVFGEGVRVGPSLGQDTAAVTVIGWNNQIPAHTVIGEGATIEPQLPAEKWKAKVAPGEVMR
ncbi:MAG: glucose-1-phosphate adenylyltransferase, partial [Desulfobulbaceae bacterium]